MEWLYRLKRKTCFLKNDKRGVVRWSGKIMTRRIKKILREKFRENVPPTVLLEMNSTCNYSCPFCPQSSRRRPEQYMTMDSFLLVIRQLEEMQFTGLLDLTGNNESFMHPLMMDFCRIISDRLPYARFRFTTNGSLISCTQWKELCELDHPPSIDVNDYTPSHSVTHKFHEFISSIPESRRISLTIRKRSRDEKHGNRAGNQPGDFHPDDYRNIICTWPFVGLFVAWNLKVYLCCSDYLHEVILGDLSKQSIMDIWLSSRYREIRWKMLTTQRADLPFCRNCESDWQILPEHLQEKW